MSEETIAEIVKRYRTLKRLNLREMGRELGVSYETIRRWEAREAEPTAEVMERAYAADGWKKTLACEVLEAWFPGVRDNGKDDPKTPPEEAQPCASEAE